METVHIREATESDLNDVLQVERQAFGRDDEALLVKALLEDASARPLLSLLAFKDEHAVGHILFTKARLTNTDDIVSVMLLAPLAVIPDAQGQGIGGNLVTQGLQRLSDAKVDLVFVLGHPEYYPRFGFQAAGQCGFEAPYPIPENDAPAWMVQSLCPGVINAVKGTVVCADALSQPEYWHE